MRSSPLSEKLTSGLEPGLTLPELIARVGDDSPQIEKDIFRLDTERERLQRERDRARDCHKEAVALALRYREEMDHYRKALSEVRESLMIASNTRSAARQAIHRIEDALDGP